MKEKGSFEQVPPVRVGDRVLRRPRRPRRRLRAVPNIPQILRFFREIVTQPPFVPMVVALFGLMLVFSLGLYFAEHNAPSTQINSFGQALFWIISVMQTMGMSSVVVTTPGRVMVAIWAIVGCALFWSVMIATITSYFTLPRRPSKEIMATIQHNLGQLEDLSIEELEVLKKETVGLIDLRMERLKEKSSLPG